MKRAPYYCCCGASWNSAYSNPTKPRNYSTSRKNSNNPGKKSINNLKFSINYLKNHAESETPPFFLFS